MKQPDSILAASYTHQEGHSVRRWNLNSEARVSAAAFYPRPLVRLNGR